MEDELMIGATIPACEDGTPDGAVATASIVCICPIVSTTSAGTVGVTTGEIASSAVPDPVEAEEATGRTEGDIAGAVSSPMDWIGRIPSAGATSGASDPDVTGDVEAGRRRTPVGKSADIRSSGWAPG